MLIITFLYILELLLLLTLTVILLFLFQSFVTLMIVKVPFVPVPKAVLSRIIKVLDLKKDSVLYDLGCGDGRVLFAAIKKYPHIRAVGIEMAWLPLFLARVKKIFIPGKANIKILNKNFFRYDLTEASHVFTYLSSEIMDRLLPKLEKELKPGARLISCDFPFRHKKAAEVIDLGRKTNQLGKKLYIYEF